MDKLKSLLETGKLVYDIFGDPIGYITNLKKNMEQLDKNAQHLFAERDDLEKLTRQSSNVATSVSEWWLKSVEELEVEVQSIKDEHIRCSNLLSKTTLGKRVGDVIQEIADLNTKRPKLKEKEFSNALLERVERQIVEINPSTDNEPILHRIMGHIEDVGVRKIGIWGMGGIGKTRTLKLLNNRLEEYPQLFDIIIWVTVSGEGNQRKVQNDIADRLKLTVSNESGDRLRATIYEKLSGKKFLLILDDMWEKIDLSNVGIPIPDQDNGCKVLLTTREFGICQQMETDVDIPMERLSKEEAWSLFKEKVGDVAMSPDIKAIARDIVKKCDGLPLAIIVIGSSLRKNHDVAVWTNTLVELESPRTCQIRGMEKEVFSCLRISYKRLLDDLQRKLFLYCSLYAEDYEILITELAEYYWLEGYMEGVDSIEGAWNKGRHMVSNLIDASLLERGIDEKHIKMHDMIRVFALHEASRFLVRTGKHVKHPPEEKEWLQSQKISLMGCSLVHLLERPNCSTLSTLLLQDNNQLTMIPDSFFECMHSLCIIDLSGTKIKSLPSSLWKLVNLRGLYLKNCYELEELPYQVGALRQLKVLDLGGYGTVIKYLPRAVGELTGLKRLIVGFQRRKCSENDGEDPKEWNMKLRVPAGIIPKLPLLEELSLYVYFHGNIIDEGQWDDESMEVVVEELCRLEHLTYLDAYFPRVECLEHFLRDSKSMNGNSWFRRFRFRVGSDSYAYQRQQPERCLVYSGDFGTSHAAVAETLAHCSFFDLQDTRTARKLSELGLANMNELKECQVRRCEKMETLFDGDELQEACALLPILETLEILELPELRSLCDGPLWPGSLSKLRCLLLYDCKNLKKVFQLGIIRQLCSLEKLYVFNCRMIEEIIEIEEEEEIIPVASHTHDTLILPNIKEIHLFSLPELVRICRGFSNFEWPSLETVYIRKCPKFKSLSFLPNGTNVVVKAPREIHGTNIVVQAPMDISVSSSWWEVLGWEDNELKQRNESLFVDVRFPNSLQPSHHSSSPAAICHIIVDPDVNNHTNRTVITWIR